MNQNVEHVIHMLVRYSYQHIHIHPENYHSGDVIFSLFDFRGKQMIKRLFS